MAVADAARLPVETEDGRVALPRVAWDTYERLLADDEERRVPRLTYDRGVLELVSPALPHEKSVQTLTLVVEIVAALLGIPILSVGSMTYRRRDLERGFDPAAGFYARREASVWDRAQIDPAADPPPDVILEMVISRTVVDRLPLFGGDGRSQGLALRRSAGHDPDPQCRRLPGVTHQRSPDGIAERTPLALSGGEPNAAQASVGPAGQRLGAPAAAGRRFAATGSGCPGTAGFGTLQ